MTTITVKKKSAIESIVISGHSGYKSEGSDIVCASISSMVITTVNACLKVDETSIDYEKKNGFVKIDIKKQDSMVILLIENMISLLEELASQYSKYVKVTEEVYL